MSLFGGSQPPPPTSPPSAHLATFASSPPPHPSSEPATAPALSIELDEVDDDSGSDTDDDERDNKFAGTTSAWKRHAENELNLHSSLSHLAADDISRHLYIAHTLRPWFRSPPATNIKPYQSKRRWGGAGAQENVWNPPRKWTAWPLKPSEVPRKWERFGEVPEIDPEDEFTIREEGFLKCKPSRDLEELVLSVALRRAKEQWSSREEERTPRQMERSIRQRRKPNDKNEDSDSSGNGPRHQSRGQVSRDAKSETSSSLRRQSTIDRDRALGNIRPIVTTDDDAAQQILQPSIRSLLNNLDSLLAALHRSRQNHLDGARNTKAKNKGPEKRKVADTDAQAAEAEPPRKRARGRPRKVRELEPPDPSSPPGLGGPNELDAELPLSQARDRPSKAQELGPLESTPAPSLDEPTEQDAGPVQRPATVRGRPKTLGSRRLPGESYYLLRKRLQEEETAAAATPVPEEPPPPENHHRQSSSASDSSDGSAVDDATINARRPGGSRTFGLRDWSEILGTAALIGAFKPSVVQRAAQRCSNIFKEGMKFHTLNERSALEEDPGKAVEYVPGLVLPPLLDQPSDIETGDHHTGATNDEVSDNEEETNAGDEPRPLWDGISKSCPHVSCQRHDMPYRLLRQLIMHVRMKHGYSLPPITDAFKDKATSDGFLEPIKGRSGWRTRDAAPREKRGKASAETRITDTRRNAEQVDEREQSGVEGADVKAGSQDGNVDGGMDESD
ncbi:hypothetical protein IWZ03DRAFT_422701 [Phyllosticta citriasiana]|uniref:Rrn9 domain-containing protein n=1 Tax=Phyllosticta citriasiana TaxID=595635 RepID=A0ABR1KR20_9PEZI